MLRETPATIRNIGWTLGDHCPFGCKHCYSTIVRKPGASLTKEGADRICRQLHINGIKTVNLGGNEPIYTGSTDPKESLLPRIVENLTGDGILTGLTTAGVTVTWLEKHRPDTMDRLNDCDISLDSPFAAEHNENRGAKLYDHALTAIDICESRKLTHTIVMCGMNWNLSERHLRELVNIAKSTGSNVRINFIKPTEPKHQALLPSLEQYYFAVNYLMANCDPLDTSEPMVGALMRGAGSGCPCGVHSFRIHSITPEGVIPVSPCVYAHAYRTGDLLTDELADIMQSEPFRAFRRRHANPGVIDGCNGCEFLETCRGGCASRSYLARDDGDTSLYNADPYCIINAEKEGVNVGEMKNRYAGIPDDLSVNVVHRNYLCTMIMRPK